MPGRKQNNRWDRDRDGGTRQDRQRDRRQALLKDDGRILRIEWRCIGYSRERIVSAVDDIPW